MSKLFVVTDQTDATSLAGALAGKRIGAAKREALIAAVRLANPGVDFDSLTTGTILTVPEVPEVATSAADPVDAALDDLLGRAQESLKQLLEAAAAGEAARREAADATREVITDPELTKLAGQVPQLKANLASIDKRLAQDDAEAAEADATLGKAVEQWQAGLDALRGLRG